MLAMHATDIIRNLKNLISRIVKFKSKELDFFFIYRRFIYGIYVKIATYLVA